MIAGGNATVYVSNMDAAVGFYGQTLGLKVTNRFGDRWATIDAGPSYWTSDEVGAGLVLGLHPAGADLPIPGTKGSVMFGLETYTPIDEVVAVLSARGVRFSGSVVRFEAGNSIALEDPDGNPIYIHEFPPEMLDETEAPSAEPEQMLTGGHAIVYVRSIDAAVHFYTKVLGLPLTNRYNDHWATVEAGRDLVIGLHPRSSHYPAPGTKGATILGLTVDQPIERVISHLSQRGVKVSGAGAERASIDIVDGDGNPIRLSSRVPAAVREDALAAGG
jgi:catechol 2,3-dioxygenase-like lactoylglutathione lyase family enzyme